MYETRDWLKGLEPSPGLYLASSYCTVIQSNPVEHRDMAPSRSTRRYV